MKIILIRIWRFMTMRARYGMLIYLFDDRRSAAVPISSTVVPRTRPGVRVAEFNRNSHRRGVLIK